MHAKSSCFYSRYIRKHVFLFLKIRGKPTSPAMRNNEFISRSLMCYEVQTKSTPASAQRNKH